MAKHKKSHKSSKCPEPFNTLIDIAGGIAMNAIANKAEKKYHYSKKGKINPYRVSAFKIATGGFKSTSDIIRTGGFLGAMGSFDVEADTPSKKPARIRSTYNSPTYRVKRPPTKNNSEAWRLNTEEGKKYGLNPNDYPNRYEYKAALDKAQASIKSSEKTITGVKTEEKESCDVLILKVSLLTNGSNEYYLPNDESIKVGNKVLVEDRQQKQVEGIVVSIEHYSGKNVSINISELSKIIKVIRE